jgi:hypothetical protein
MEKLNLIAVLFFCYQRFDLAHLGPNQFPFIYCFYYKILKRGLWLCFLLMAEICEVGWLVMEGSMA